MKKIKWFLISILFLPIMVSAKGTGTISVTSTSQVVVNNKITVTVKLTSSTLIGSWQMQLNYDKNYLQLTNATSEAKGVMMADSSATGIKSKSYTFTFKTLKTGSTKLSVSSYEAYDFNDPSSTGEIELSSTSKTIKIITQEELEASYSKDNNLKSLSVEGYELSPTFNKDTLNYSINVPEGTTKIKVNATASDSKSHISGVGDIDVTSGINTVNVVVRAENGSEKTYVILVNVIDENPINVTIGNLNYTVIKLRDNYTCPLLYEESEIKINGFDVPSCYNENVGYTLVGLKKDDGTVENFIYNDGKYTKYVETIGTSLKVIILNYEEDLKGFKKYEEKIDGINYTVFKVSDDASNYVVYAQNIETGKKDFYNYDSINKTFSLYDNEALDKLIKLNETYLYVIIIFLAGLLLSLICLISGSIVRKKEKNKETKVDDSKNEKSESKENNNKDDLKIVKNKKKKDKLVEEETIKEDNSEIKEKEDKKPQEEKTEETKEFYDIFEDDKIKKKKNK